MKKTRWLTLWIGTFVIGFSSASGARQSEDESAVKTIRNIAYTDAEDADDRKHKLDLYLPKDKKRFPVLMFVHGGAWSTGDKMLYGPGGHTFAKEGVGFACISYRLAPGATHPDQVEDVARAFAWLHRNISEYGGDPKRLFVSGHSAGGHLVALLALNEKYLKAHKLSSKDIAGVLPISGVYRIRENASGAFGTELKGWKDASPLDHVREGTPPWLILYAEKDYPNMPGDARQLYKGLKAKLNDAELLEIPDKNHITIILGVAMPGDKTAAAMLTFIRNHSKPRQ